MLLNARPNGGKTQNLELIKCVQRIKKRNLNTRKQSNKATFYLLKALIWAEKNREKIRK